MILKYIMGSAAYLVLCNQRRIMSSTSTSPISFTNADIIEHQLASQLIELVKKLRPSYISAENASDANKAARSSAEMLIRRAAVQMTPQSVKCANAVSQFVGRPIPGFEWTLSCKVLKPYHTVSGGQHVDLGYTVKMTASGGWDVPAGYSTCVAASMVLTDCKFGIRIAEDGFEAIEED